MHHGFAQVPLEDVGRYMRLVEKLNYLTVIRPDIAFAVSILSQFLLASGPTHLEAMRILRYLKAPGRCFFLIKDTQEQQASQILIGCPSEGDQSKDSVFLGGNFVS